MICMLIVGYCVGIRSERRLCEGVHLNLRPLSKNRHGAFARAMSCAHLFETVVVRRMAEGLVGADGLAVDAIFEGDNKLNGERP
jgi:transposase